MTRVHLILILTKKWKGSLHLILEGVSFWWSVAVSHLSIAGQIYIRSFLLSKISNETIARRVIKKHPKSVAHVFHIAKEEEKGLRILDGLSKDNAYSITEIIYKFKMVFLSPFKFIWYSKL